MMKTITGEDVVWHEKFVFDSKDARYDISVITVEVPSIVGHLGLNFLKATVNSEKKLTAVGLDRRRKYSWKHFQNRITMLSAKVVRCDENNVICIHIEGGKASSSVGDSGKI